MEARGWIHVRVPHVCPRTGSPTFTDLTTDLWLWSWLYAGRWVASPPPLGGSTNQEGRAATKTRDGDWSQSGKEVAARRDDSTG